MFSRQSKRITTTTKVEYQSATENSRTRSYLKLSYLGRFLSFRQQCFVVYVAELHSQID